MPLKLPSHDATIVEIAEYFGALWKDREERQRQQWREEQWAEEQRQRDEQEAEYQAMIEAEDEFWEEQADLQWLCSP